VLEGLRRAQELGLDLTGIEVVRGDVHHSPRQWGFEDPTECSRRPAGVGTTTASLLEVLERGCPECAHGIDDHSLRHLSQGVVRVHDELEALEERSAKRLEKLGEVLHRTRSTKDKPARVRGWVEALRARWQAEHEEVVADADLVRSWCAEVVRAKQGDAVLEAALASGTTYLCASTRADSALGALLLGKMYSGIGGHTLRVTHLDSLGAHALGNIGNVFAVLEVPPGADGTRAAETAQVLLREGTSCATALSSALALEE
jgi:hypothetical protein